MTSPDRDGVDDEYDSPHSSRGGMGDLHGAAHFGSGNQYNQWIVVAALRRRRLATISDEPGRPFVLPPNWEGHLQRLPRTGMLLLDGEPGNGRRTAALRLLENHRAGTDQPLREMFWEQAPDENRPHLDLEEIGRSTRLLVDLSSVPSRQSMVVQDELRRLSGAVSDHSAFAAVVLPTGSSRLPAFEWRSSTIEVERPPPHQVLRAHLERHGIMVPTPLPVELSEFETSARMADLVDLSWHAAKAMASEPKAGVVHWLTRALDACRDQRGAVAQQVSRHADWHQRALLLAAAVFVGCTPGTVLVAENRLLRSLGCPEDSAHEFVGPGVDGRLAEVKAASNSGRVSFSTPAYDQAVRHHFWTQFPGQLDGLRAWFLSCPDLIAGQNDEMELIGRFVDECLDAERPRDVTIAVEEWSETRRYQRLAQIALTLGLLDPLHGWRMRRQCYRWATDNNLPRPLAELVIAASRDVIAREHPSQAVVRLHHLVRHTDDRVTRAATAALVVAAERDDRVLRSLLARLTERTDAPTRAHDRTLFLAVAKSTPLIIVGNGHRPVRDDGAVRDQLVRGWAGVYDHVTKDEYRPRLREWLDAHAVHDDADDLLHILLHACHGQTAAMSTLFATGHHWRREPGAGDGRDRTFRRLEDLIAAARARPSDDTMNGEDR